MFLGQDFTVFVCHDAGAAMMLILASLFKKTRIIWT
jgi:hypothetical protein